VATHHHLNLAAAGTLTKGGTDVFNYFAQLHGLNGDSYVRSAESLDIKQHLHITDQAFHLSRNLIKQLFARGRVYVSVAECPHRGNQWGLEIVRNGGCGCVTMNRLSLQGSNHPS